VLELGRGWVPWEQGAASRKKKKKIKKKNQNKKPSAVYSLQFNVWPHSPESLPSGSLVLNMLPKTTQAFFPPSKTCVSFCPPSLLGLLFNCCFPGVLHMSMNEPACFKSSFLHRSFQVVCPVPQYPLFLSFPHPPCPGVQDWNHCSMMSRPRCSLYLCSRSLTMTRLLPPGTIWVWGGCSLWNLLVAWNLLNCWPTLGNSDFHAVGPMFQGVPWWRSQEELLVTSHLSIHSLSEDAKQGTCVYFRLLCEVFPLHSARASFWVCKWCRFPEPMPWTRSGTKW